MDKNINPFTVISGASKGLGKEFALICAREKRNLVLISLESEGLEEFGKRLEQEHGIRVLTYVTDLTGKDAVEKFFKWLKNQSVPVDILINNAGVGGSSAITNISPSDIVHLINLNTRVLTLMTYYFVPELKKRKRAYILNIASMAAMTPMPYKTVYAATKAYVYSFSRGLQKELRKTPVHVSVVIPGPLTTNKEVIERISGQGFLGRFFQTCPKDAAAKSLRAMYRKRCLITPGFSNKLNYLIIKFTPIHLRLRYISRVFKKEG